MSRIERNGRLIGKVRTAADAVELINDNATVAIGGTGVVLEPTAVLEALQNRFLSDGHPRDLTVIAPMCPGDRPGVGGLNCIAHDGMLSKLIGSSFNLTRHPGLIAMLGDGRCEGYTVGMGTLVQLMTAIGSGKPGVFTTAGIGTFLDPREEGGRMNERSNEPPGRIMELEGEDYIFYPRFPIDVAIIRATTADENGYLSMEEEPNSLGMLEIALAAKASGGRVIAQVKRVAKARSLDARLVRVPGPLVDVIVVDAQQTQLSPQMADPLDGWNPFLTGGMQRALDDLPPVPPGPGRILLRRAALELRRDDVINVGAGVATNLPRIVQEEGALEDVVFTNEHGVFGGLMGTALGGSFVPALNADAIMDSAFQFNYYDGGGLDIAFLGMGEVDRDGNVNVSRFSQVWNGPGGFADITDRTPRIVVCGTLTAGGLRTEVRKGGSLHIGTEGTHKKFVDRVQQVTLNGPNAHRKGQSVRYVTERAVFELTARGLRLIEIADGIDLRRDVLEQMGFRPEVADDLRTFPAEVMADGRLNLQHFLQQEVNA